MNPSWIDSYYEAIEFFYWEPQHLGKKRYAGAGFKASSLVAEHLRQMEVTLNQNLHQFFTLAPEGLRNRLHASEFNGKDTSPFRLFGRDVDKHFSLDNGMQPDLLFLSDSTVFSIEMKIAAKCSVSQVLKYALLGLAAELKTERQLEHSLLTMAPGPFSSLWRERIGYPEELREALLAADLTEFLAGKHNRYREHVDRLRQIIENMELAHTTYADLSRFLAKNGPDDADTSAGAEVYRKLVAGLVNELTRRRLLMARTSSEGILPDGRLAAQMSEVVVDLRFQLETKRKMIARGIPKEVMDRLIEDPTEI